MAIVKFTATRNLATGYTSGDYVTIVFKLVESKRQAEVESDSDISLGGVRRKNVFRFDDYIDVVTQYFSGEKRDVFEMFLESVRAGETFEANFRGDDQSLTSYYHIADGKVPFGMKDLGLRLSQYSFKVKKI